MQARASLFADGLGALARVGNTAHITPVLPSNHIETPP
jgi:hypothetical protein